MATNLKPITQNDFSGGANLVVNPYLINQKQAADLQNLILDEHGSLRTRDGYITLTTSPITDQPILFRGALVTVAGVETPFAIQRISGGVNRLYKTAGSPWTAVSPDFSTGEDLPDVVYMADNAVIIRGYEVATKFNGTTLTNIVGGTGTVPPGAKHGAFHLGSLWLWNTNATTTSLDGPSSLRMSDPNDPDEWPNANQTFISKDDGQVGMGLSSFTIVETGISPTATLLAFKNYSAYQVTSVFGAADFSVQRIKSDMGSIAPRTIEFVSGFGVIRLTHKGFALYNGVEDRLISEEVRPAIFGGRGFTSLNFSEIHRSWSAQSQNPPLYIVACPVAGTALTRIFIYDLIRRGWSLATLPTPVSCLNLYLVQSQFPVIHAGTQTGGKILELFNGQTTDDGLPIDWSFKSRAYFVGSHMQSAFWRRAHVNVAGPPNKSVTVTPIVDGAERSDQSFTLPDSTATEVEDTIAPDILETAHHLQLKVAGAGAFKIRGVEPQASPKPLTKFKSRA